MVPCYYWQCWADYHGQNSLGLTHLEVMIWKGAVSVEGTWCLNVTDRHERYSVQASIPKWWMYFFYNYALLHAVPSPSFNDIRLFSVMIILMFDFQLFLKDWFVVIFSIDKHGKEIQKVFAFEGRNFFWGKVKKRKRRKSSLSQLLYRSWPGRGTSFDGGERGQMPSPCHS